MDDLKNLMILDVEVGVNRLAGDRELYEQILEIFFTEAERQIAQLEEAVANGEHRTVMQIAHSIKGAASNIGALRIQKVAFELEKIGNENRMGEAVDVFTQLKDEFQQIKEFWYEEAESVKY